MIYKKEQGFTLMELMIAVVIVGILAAFALPSYFEQVERSRQTEGQALLARILQGQERYFTENLTYTSTLTDLGYNSDTNIESEEGYYKVSAGVCDAPSTPNVITGCVKVSGTSTTGGKDLFMDSLGNHNFQR